ncbi:glycosyltransferase [Pseudokineococcus basanitobsidens]|uniref:Glycosyltransferase n=1 Tax=Pseudokineococcus basanitobsidens TaxID=1926649 RepID=A0ABU8RG74_9ACTN
MRVAFVSEVWAPEVDGLVTRLERTVEALRADGHEVLVVAPTAGTAVPGVLETRTRGLRLPFLYGGRRWALPDGVVARALRAFVPDVVHVVNPVLMGVVGARWALPRYPVVVSYHTDVATYAGHYHLGIFEGVVHRSMRQAYRPADVRLATSSVGREHLAEIGIDDVRLWARGVDLAAFRPGRDGSALRARLRAPVRPVAGDDDVPVALHVGRVATEKGTDRLARLASAEPPVHLALVGDGPDRRRLETELAGRQVTFTGLLRGDDLADAYAAADALVFASTTDTLGLVLLEAMASGLPVVALDSPTSRATLAGYGPATFVARAAPPGAWNTAVHAASDAARRAGDARGAGSPGRTAVRAAAARPTDDWACATRRLVEDVYADAVRRGAARLARR